MFRKLTVMIAGILMVAQASSAVKSATEPAQLWELDVAGRVAGTPIFHEGRLVFAAADQLYSVDKDGSIAWQWQLDGVMLASPVASSGRFYVHTDKGITAYSEAGTKIWHHRALDQGPIVASDGWGWGDGDFLDPWGFYRSTPLLVGDMLLFGDTSGVHALDARSGDLIWSRDMGPVTTDIRQYEDNIIVGSWDNQLYSLKIATGEETWRFKGLLPLNGGEKWSGWKGFNLTPAVDGDSIYAGTRGAYFYGLNAKDGSVNFSAKSGLSWIGSPAVVTEKEVFFGLSDGASVQGHEKRLGTQTFFLKTGGLVFAQPLMVDGYLIIGTLNGEVIVVKRETGERQSVKFHDIEGGYGAYFAKDRHPDLTPHEKSVQGVEDFLTERHSVLSMAVQEGVLYVGTGSGKLKAFDLARLKGQ